MVTLLAVFLSALACGAAEPPMPPTVADGAKLAVVYSDDRFFEGPAWDPVSGRLYFTAFRNQDTQVLRLEAPGKVTVWMDQTRGVNGMHLSRTGRLLGAQAFGHNLLSMKIGPNGPEDVNNLASGFQGQTFNQPNDVTESPSGGMYFTDPDFDTKTKSAVYYLSVDGKLSRVITHLKIPNGIVVSNDGKTLYVSDSFEKRVYSYPINLDGSVDLGKVSIFFDPVTENRNDPDGMCSDAEGNLYFAMRGGIWVVSPAGKTLGLIAVPEFCSNLTFGGKDGKTLYITGDKKVYSLAMKARGAKFR